MDDNPLLEHGLSIPTSKVLEPQSPKKELIGAFVTVFRSIPRASLSEVRSRGIPLTDNRRATNAPEIEQIFSEAALAHGNKTDRTKCIFAFPRDPRKESLGLSYNPKEEALVTMRIDPKGVIVANGEYVTEAQACLDRDDKEGAIDWAKDYYDESMTLKDYLTEHTGKEDDVFDFTMPEVLIPTDIPAYRIEVID